MSETHDFGEDVPVIRGLEHVEEPVHVSHLVPSETEIMALGQGVREVTRLIEDVGRTLEAQNQRSLRLMERLEKIAEALEALPEESDRNLEALDAVEAAISRQTAPLERVSERLAALPDVLSAVRAGNESTRELWGEAARAFSGRMALGALQAEERGRREGAEAERRRARRRLVFAAVVAALGIGGAGAANLFGAKDAVRDAVARVTGANRPVEAEQGDEHWRVIRVGALDAVELAPPSEQTTIVTPAVTVPSGLVKPVDVTPAPAPGPRVEGSLVIEEVGPKPKTELVPSLVQPLN